MTLYNLDSNLGPLVYRGYTRVTNSMGLRGAQESIEIKASSRYFMRGYLENAETHARLLSGHLHEFLLIADFYIIFRHIKC